VVERQSDRGCGLYEKRADADDCDRREADAAVSLQELTVEGARPDELVEMQKKAVPLSKSVGFPRYCQNGQVGWWRKERGWRGKKFLK
jgi:hypothetical protein